MTPTAESRQVAAGIASCGMTRDAIAARLGVEPSNISHWESGFRPVPAARAKALGELIGKGPELISAKYRVLHQQIGSTKVAEGAATYDLEVARLQNDVRAIGYALSALTAVMVAHRPAEARDAADALRRTIPAHFRDIGLIRELLAALDRAGHKATRGGASPH